MRLILCLIALLWVGGCTRVNRPSRLPNGVITAYAVDGTKVFLYPRKGYDRRGVILLFHQAGSSADEYAPIAPKLNKLGWDTLAVDLRSGGDMYGTNRTVEALGRNGDYMSAYQDVEAALDYIRSQKYKKVVAWGSSYSASLVGKLAAEHKEVSKVVAFSPGEYMDDKSIVHQWYMKVKVPVFDVWADDEEPAVKQLTNGTKATVFGSKDYIHGSSTLRPEKNAPGVDQLWKQLENHINGG